MTKLERWVAILGLVLIAYGITSMVAMTQVPVCDSAWRCLKPEQGDLEFSDSDGEAWAFDASASGNEYHFDEFRSFEDESRAREGEQRGLFWHGELVALERAGDRMHTRDWGVGANYPKAALASGLVVLGGLAWRSRRRRTNATSRPTREDSSVPFPD